MSKRTALLEAAKTLLWEVGYQEMSPRLVQERAAAGQGSFYHHFEGKLDLAAEALWQVATEMTERAAGAMRDEAAPIRRVRAYLHLGREPLRGCRLGRLAHEEAIAEPTLRTPIEAHFTAVERMLTAALDEVQEAGGLDAELDTRALATTLVAAVQGGCVLARVHQDAEAFERAVEGALALLGAALRSA